MLQFSHLLDPISSDNPVGSDISFSSDVDAINEARQFDDPSLDQGEWVTAVKEADWDFVYEKCQELLLKQTKDLRIAGWLTEAAAKTKQFEGMAAGFELMARLCDTYWDPMYPKVEDGDLEQRSGNIRWLLSRSAQLVKEVPLTEGRGSQYAWIDFEAARVRASVAAKTGEPLAEIEGQPNPRQLEAIRRKCSKAFYESLINSLAHCQSMLAQLETSLDARLGREGPSFTALKDTLETIYKLVQRYGADVGLKLTGMNPSEPEKEQTQDTARSQDNRSAPLGPIANRAQALEQLRKVAEYFRATEPHSPVAYLADKAANWGDLPLHSWLKTVVKDPASLAFLEEMLGVHSQEQPPP